jgi:hypothetical protein
MKIKMSSSKSTPIVCLLCCLLLLAPMVGAGQSENTKQAAGKAAKAAKAESCDGAADIVPAKPVSFARKRRPAPKSQSAESKPDKTQ